MRKRYGAWVAAVLFLFIAVSVAGGETYQPFVDTLKGQEWKYRDTQGEIHLGKVATLIYRPYSVAASNHYRPLLKQLAAALKTPARKEYSLVLRGYTDDSGSTAANQRISLKRAQALKELLTEDPALALSADRIQVEGRGEADPVASNQTTEGRDRNRRVEIHIYGNVREAVRSVAAAPPAAAPVAVPQKQPVAADDTPAAPLPRQRLHQGRQPCACPFSMPFATAWKKTRRSGWSPLLRSRPGKAWPMLNRYTIPNFLPRGPSSGIRTCNRV